MEKKYVIAMSLLGFLLAAGMTFSAYVLGSQARKAVPNKNQITVKGLAIKNVQADSAEWTITISVTEPTFAQALERLRNVRPVLDAFLQREGFEKNNLVEGNENVSPHYVTIYMENGSQKQEQQGYDAVQNITVVSRDLKRVTAASRNILSLQAEGHPITTSPPLFLVSNLEEIKMSLIADATANARKRAEEFVRQDGARVGAIRSASQGAFYILPEGAAADSDDYGGVYDKSTINKTAKVVVTIVYGIEN